MLVVFSNNIMNTLIDKNRVEKYKKQIRIYLKRKKIEKLFDMMVKGVLLNKPDNVMIYLYKNMYSFLLNKIFIIGPPFLKINSKLSASLAKIFDYYHISINSLIKAYINENGEEFEEDKEDTVLINDDLVCSIMKSTLENLNAKEKTGYIVEGFPRNNIQADMCLKLMPTHTIIIQATEGYICKKYEEENNVTLFTGKHRMLNLEKENNKTSTNPYVGRRYELLTVFEVKEVDPTPLKEKIQLYQRNITGLLNMMKTSTVITLEHFRNDDEVIQYVVDVVCKNKDEWRTLLTDRPEEDSEDDTMKRRLLERQSQKMFEGTINEQGRQSGYFHFPETYDF